jgi:hypothetical protein
MREAQYAHYITVYTATDPVGPFVYKHRFSKVYPYTGIGAGE